MLLCIKFPYSLFDNKYENKVVIIMSKNVLNEREMSPAENAWEEYKDLITISLPKRIKIINHKLQNSGQTIFSSEVLSEFEQVRTRLKNLEDQYKLNESFKSVPTKSSKKIKKSQLKQMINECVEQALNL